MNQIEANLTFIVPLSLAAHQIAGQFQSQDQHHTKQAYLNSLAVYAVDYYLRCLGWEPDRQASATNSPLMQRLLNLADLPIPGLGSLECRPILPGATACEIPLEAWEDRIGYVAVQFDPSLRQAEILGFVPKPTADLPLNQLQSLEDLLTHLEQLQSQPAALTQLDQWLEGIFAAGWRAIEELLPQSELALAFRNRAAVRRCKRITLGETAVILVITLEQTDDRQLDIQIELQPDVGQDYLPVGLQIAVLDGQGIDLLGAQTREENPPVQLEFSGEIGDTFRVRINLGTTCAAEDFQI